MRRSGFESTNLGSECQELNLTRPEIRHTEYVGLANAQIEIVVQLRGFIPSRKLARHL